MERSQGCFGGSGWVFGGCRGGVSVTRWWQLEHREGHAGGVWGGPKGFWGVQRGFGGSRGGFGGSRGGSGGVGEGLEGFGEGSGTSEGVLVLRFKGQTGGDFWGSFGIFGEEFGGGLGGFGGRGRLQKSPHSKAKPGRFWGILGAISGWVWGDFREGFGGIWGKVLGKILEGILGKFWGGGGF